MHRIIASIAVHAVALLSASAPHAQHPALAAEHV
jgi:hypothetical protein